MGVFVVLLAVASVVYATPKICEWYSLTLPYGGRYCIGEGDVTRKLLPHQCRFLCLQSVTCRAYNYNVTEGTCTRFTSPCPQAYSDPTMEFVVFRKTVINKCYVWVPYSYGDPLDERMISTDIPEYIVSRLKVSGNDVVCYMTTNNGKCYGTLGGIEYNSDVYGCERLCVMEGCTTFWVPYTAGGPLPSRAVIGGVMANGDVAYVVKFDIIHNGDVKSISGYYIRGAAHATSGFAGTRHAKIMMMMVVL